MKEGKIDKEEKIYEAAKKVGKLKEVEISGELTNDFLLERIWENKEQYIKKYIKKVLKLTTILKSMDKKSNIFKLCSLYLIFYISKLVN